MKKFLIILSLVLCISQVSIASAFDKTYTNEETASYIIDKYNIEMPIASSNGQILGASYSTRVDDYRIIIASDGLNMLVNYHFEMFFDIDFDINIHYVVDNSALVLDTVHLGIFKNPSFLNDKVLDLLKLMSFDLTKINLTSLFPNSTSVELKEDSLKVYYDDNVVIDDNSEYQEINEDDYIIDIVNNTITLENDDINDFVNNKDLRQTLKDKYNIDGIVYNDGKLYLSQNSDNVVIECNFSYRNDYLEIDYYDVYINNIKQNSDEVREYFTKYSVKYNSFRDYALVETSLLDEYISKNANAELIITNIEKQNDKYIITLVENEVSSTN